MKRAVLRRWFGRWLVDEVRPEYGSKRHSDLEALGYKLVAVECVQA